MKHVLRPGMYKRRLFSSGGSPRYANRWQPHARGRRQCGAGVQRKSHMSERMGTHLPNNERFSNKQHELDGNVLRVVGLILEMRTVRGHQAGCCREAISSLCTVTASEEHLTQTCQIDASTVVYQIELTKYCDLKSMQTSTNQQPGVYLDHAGCHDLTAGSI